MQRRAVIRDEEAGPSNQRGRLSQRQLPQALTTLCRPRRPPPPFGALLPNHIVLPTHQTTGMIRELPAIPDSTPALTAPRSTPAPARQKAPSMSAAAACSSAAVARSWDDRRPEARSRGLKVGRSRALKQLGASLCIEEDHPPKTHPEGIRRVSPAPQYATSDGQVARWYCSARKRCASFRNPLNHGRCRLSRRSLSDRGVRFKQRRR